MSKKLPIGLQDFRGIIEGGYKYIDKTRYVYNMCMEGKYYFLSRPRRFGKSITISVLNELYSGSRELFQNLWIEDNWDWNKCHPILHISFTTIGFQSLGLEVALVQELDHIASNHKISLVKKGIAGQFRELIESMALDKKVAVLIDEYDAPIIHYLGKDLEKAYQNREILKEFYSILKDADEYIEFVFITGVSKFSKVGIFSGLNNLSDLSMHPKYATMLGYTQEELETNFEEEIASTAVQMNIKEETLLSNLRQWYNGYRFEENAESVYNPISCNLFFSRRKFDNFWFATGTPTFLIEVLKNEGVFDLKNEEQTLLDFESFDLEDLRAYGLLYQTGYLTIKSKDEYGLYHLDYPNFEVKHSMLAYLIEAFGGVKKGTGISMAVKLEKAFQTGDVEQVIRILQTLFKSIPYILYDKYPEKFYHAAVHLIFSIMGLRIQSEVNTSDGRVDCVVETETNIYILEFKIDQNAQIALDQIKQKNYYQAYWEKGKPVLGIGINFASETKNISDWVVGEMN